MTLRCDHCGEERLVELVRETAGGTKLITCKVCSRDSVQFTARNVVCPDCGRVNSHDDICAWMQRAWGV